ncbi:SGNH/GDSL hydrolase family protein [Streptomyces sp. ICBB 8177]|uniref:SGNH/GDSL hydrolase family protein n=1 Tax=Streptomyces sp. ICBB 8177 TaxID=563922 RepID=UPI000D682393|nr:SGNH/GDSL hydrolase family protein [Streptomyces sp. ICBB 8177]PWI45312.1 SGNH hydrolase [Streptomyces sp. ICBB 8177]
MTRKSGYTLAAALLAVMAVVCAVIVAGVDHAAAPVTDEAAPQPHATLADPASAGDWVASWATSPAAGEPNTRNGYPGMSIRNVVHADIGGTAARVQVSNLFGAAPLTLTDVTLAVAAGPGGADAVPGALVRLAFDGRPTVTIPAGASVLSDPVRLRVPAAADLLVTTYTPDPSGPVTYHPMARETSYLARGDHARDTDGTAFTEQTPYWRYVTGVDVWTADATGTVVAFGDSITDGRTSTVGADHRWPDYLAQRLRSAPNGPRLSVVDEGISGNRLLSNAQPDVPGNGRSGLSRLDRDALSQPGAKVLIVDLGINDILQDPRTITPDAVVAGLQAITREAHAHGLRVVGSTLTPFRGTRGWTPRLEAVRERVDEVIRSGRVFDAVVDFDKALRDPMDPERLRPAYDSGDHLHPTDAGYRAMADAIELDTLTGAAPAGV